VGQEIPQSIVELMNESRTLFETKSKLWIHVRGLIEDALKSSASTIFRTRKCPRVIQLEFRLIAQPGGSDRLYHLDMGIGERTFQNYVMTL